MACRSPCGPRSGAPSVSRSARWTTRRTTRGSIRLPRSPRNMASPEFRGNQLRPALASQASTARTRRRANGNGSLLAALAEDPDQPVARRSRSSRSRPHSSETRIPLAYNNFQHGDVASGDRPPGFSGGSDSFVEHRAAVACSSVGGRTACGLGDCSFAAGSTAMPPARGPRKEHPRRRRPPLRVVRA